MKNVSLLTSGLVFFIAASSTQAATVYYQPAPIPQSVLNASPELSAHITNGWLNDHFDALKKFQQTDDKLQIGGWGDRYASLVKFDLAGLPTTVDSAALYLYALPSGAANPSQMSMYRITSSWNPTTLAWSSDNALPTTAEGYSWPISTAVNTWRGYTITSWYNAWKNGSIQNNGIFLWPFINDGTQRFDKFASSRVTAPAIGNEFSMRPILGLTFTPTLELKMPLPGDLSWLITTEAGGYDCLGPKPENFPWPDTAHQNSNYFSIDFSWRTAEDHYADPNTNSLVKIPVIAAAGGQVVFADIVTDPSNPKKDNGYYVVINHNGGTEEDSAGFSTRYLHLQGPPSVTKGKTVVQGEILGYMGKTGFSPGVHLHFGVRYNNSGAVTVPELGKVVMEGMILKGYQTECSTDTAGNPIGKIRYYRSSNQRWYYF